MISLSPNSWLSVIPHAVPCTTIQFDELWSQCPTVKQRFKFYGKEVEMPRFQRLYGEARYSFSGITLTPTPELPPLVQRCMDRAKQLYPIYHWGGALVNFYPDGQSYISPHADSEFDLVEGAPILSFSFGGERTFQLKHKKEEDGASAYVKDIKLPTHHESLIMMGGDTQKEFLHGVPKQAKGEPRINITVRCFRQADAKRQKLVEEENKNS